jgi:maleamate amidohydrolase
MTTNAGSGGIAPSRTALIVMHYQTDILGLFPSVAPGLLANTRRLLDAARAKGVSVYFANLRFSPGYPEVSPLNRNGQGIKSLGLFLEDRIAPELGQQANEPLVIAHRASVFFGTDLEAQLSGQGIDSLIMVGIASTGVVLSSVAYAATRTSACTRSRIAVTTRTEWSMNICLLPHSIHAQQCCPLRMRYRCSRRPMSTTRWRHRYRTSAFGPPGVTE